MDAAADAARYQLKDAPESPFTVEFATEVLVEIRQSALEAFRSLPYGGLEIGGVLFGRVSPSGRNPKKVEVAATRPMECDHAAGPAFILSSAERVRLTQLFEHARHEEDLAALAVVGFWVSHGRSELGLTSHDTDLYRAFFPHPWQVALMLKPENKQPLREALFCRVNARVVPYRRPAEPVVPPAAPVAAAPPALSTPQPTPEPTPELAAPVPTAPTLSAPEPVAASAAPPPAPPPAPPISVVPEPQYHVPEYREPAQFDHSQAVPEAISAEPAFPQQPVFAADQFRVPSFQERVWQEQSLQEQSLYEEASHHQAEPAVEEPTSNAERFQPVIPEPTVVKPPTAAELPRFATDIYLPTPPVEPPSTKTWAKDLYRPVGRARALVQASPTPAPPPTIAPPAASQVPAKADLAEEAPRLKSYWETEPEPEPEHFEPAPVFSAPPLPPPVPRTEAEVAPPIQFAEEWPLQEPLSSAPSHNEAYNEPIETPFNEVRTEPRLDPEPQAFHEGVDEQEEPENVAVLKPQDYDPNIPPSFDLPGPSTELLRKVEAVKMAGNPKPLSVAAQPPVLPTPVAAPLAVPTVVESAPVPPALPKPVEMPVVEAEAIPTPGFTRARAVAREAYVAPKPAEATTPEAPKVEASAPPQAPAAQAAEIGDELARLLVSIRAAAADTKTKRPVVQEEDDPAVHPRRPAKHSFGLVTVVLLMIAGLLLGGVLGYWFFGNHQPVAAKAPGPDLGLEMFNTGKEVLIHWDAKSPLVLNARTAELRIHDSGMVQTLLLDLSGLSKGYYRYQPTSSDVQATLIVTENDGHAEHSNASRFAE